MSYYRKKPVVIEARQFDGDNADNILEWVNGGYDGDAYLIPSGQFTGNALIIPTLEGDHRADIGDWIIKGIKGEFYPCKPDIFAATYEPAPPQHQNPPQEGIMGDRNMLAFPNPYIEADPLERGMTLRDWIAGQKLIAIGKWTPDFVWPPEVWPYTKEWHALARKARAEFCYAEADAMLAARENTNA